MNTKADFSDSLTSVEVVLDEAESYARIDGANIADSLSTERAESNAIVLEEGNGVYAMMGEHAFEVLSLGSGSEHKSCAPVNGEGLGTRFMWSKATNDTQQKMNTKPDFSDGPASFEGALNEAESYARIDGDDIAGSLSPERAESNAIVSEEGDGVYVMMGEDAVEVPPLRSGSEDKSCAPVNGKGAGTRFMWLKWGRQQLRKQLDSTSATTAAKNNVSRSKLGSKWANISVLKWHSSNEPKIVSNKHGIKLGLRLSRKTSNDDQSVTSFEEDRLDGQKRRNYDWFFTVLFLFHIGVTLFFFAIGTRVRCGATARDLIFVNLLPTHHHRFTFQGRIRIDSLLDHRVLRVRRSCLNQHLHMHDEVRWEMASKLADSLFNYLLRRFSTCTLGTGICTMYNIAGHFCTELHVLRV
jgi:hypothetical protein